VLPEKRAQVYIKRRSDRKLFLRSNRHMEEVITLEFDGGSRGNPGPAGIGVVLRAQDGTTLVTLGRSIGRATNNVAEYQALITGLMEAKKLGAKKIIIRGDSELIIRQMLGQYRVKHPDLKPLYEEAYHLLHHFDQAKIEHNLRHKNELADKLANLAMDRRADVTEVDESPDDTPAPIATQPGDKFVCARCGCAIQVIKPSPLRPHQLRPFVCQCGNKMDR
jgi:ribonuclease HI